MLRRFKLKLLWIFSFFTFAFIDLRNIERFLVGVSCSKVDTLTDMIAVQKYRHLCRVGTIFHRRNFILPRIFENFIGSVSQNFIRRLYVSNFIDMGNYRVWYKFSITTKSNKIWLRKIYLLNIFKLGLKHIPDKQVKWLGVNLTYNFKKV